jgi:hypothetical protein
MLRLSLKKRVRAPEDTSMASESAVVSADAPAATAVEAAPCHSPARVSPPTSRRTGTRVVDSDDEDTSAFVAPVPVNVEEAPQESPARAKQLACKRPTARVLDSDDEEASFAAPLPTKPKNNVVTISSSSSDSEAASASEASDDEDDEDAGPDGGSGGSTVELTQEGTICWFFMFVKHSH